MFRAITAAVVLFMALPAGAAAGLQGRGDPAGGGGLQGPGDPAAIAGRASVIDGDTLEIRNIRIRLHGIDAPESGQSCTRDGKPWRCGQAAALALGAQIAGKTILCEARYIDHHCQLVSICFDRGDDIGARLVRQGWALAYRKSSIAYVDEEEEAREARRNIWAGDFIPPWEWRRQHQGNTSIPVPSSRTSGSPRPGPSSDRLSICYAVPENG